MGHLKKAILIASATLCFNLSAFSQGITLKNSNVTVKEAMEQLEIVGIFIRVFIG